MEAKPVVRLVLDGKSQHPVHDLEEAMQRAERHIGAGKCCWIGVYRGNGQVPMARLCWDPRTSSWKTSPPPPRDLGPLCKE